MICSEALLVPPDGIAFREARSVAHCCGLETRVRSPVAAACCSNASICVQPNDVDCHGFHHTTPRNDCKTASLDQALTEPGRRSRLTHAMS